MSGLYETLFAVSLLNSHFREGGVGLFWRDQPLTSEKKIVCIAWLREEAGVSLSDAKKHVDALWVELGYEHRDRVRRKHRARVNYVNACIGRVRETYSHSLLGVPSSDEDAKRLLGAMEEVLAQVAADVALAVERDLAGEIVK